MDVQNGEQNDDKGQEDDIEYIKIGDHMDDMKVDFEIKNECFPIRMSQITEVQKHYLAFVEKFRYKV